jgi:hypothetical protein
MIEDRMGSHDQQPSQIAVAHDGPKDFLASMRSLAANYRRDRTQGQSRKLMISCEAAGMVPQLGATANPYGVPVFSPGGFDSVTEKFKLAEKIISIEGRLVELLHIGDLDQSGVHTALNLAEDVQAFLNHLGGHAEFTRLAVTPEQIARLRLPTAPPKLSDKRAYGGSRTCQAEAVAPDEMARIVRAAIESRYDMGVFRALLAEEEAERQQLIARLG